MTDKPCSHLEQLLPSMRDGDPPQYLSGERMANFTCNVFQAYLPTFNLEQFQTMIRSYGFVDSWDIELLTMKYYHGMGVRKIANEASWVGKDTVHRRLRYLHEELVRRGFKPKGKK